MQNAISNILKLIHRLSGSRAVYLLKCDGPNALIISEYGNMPDKDLLVEFNKEIALRSFAAEKFNEASEWPSFHKVSVSCSIESALIRPVRLRDENPERLLAVILFDKKPNSAEEISEMLEPAWDVLLDYLSLNGRFIDNLDIKRIVTEADMGLTILDREGHILFINRQGKELLRMSDEELRTFPFGLGNTHFCDESGKPLELQDFPFMEVLRTGKSILDKTLRLSGQNGFMAWLNVNTMPIRNESAEITEVLSIFIDVTEFRNIEEYLKDTTRNIESVLYSVDKDARSYFFITDAVRKLFGFTPEEVINNPRSIVRNILPEDLRRFKNFVKTVREGTPSVIEMQVRDIWGNIHHIRNSGFPVVEQGQVARIDGIISDITKEKEIRHELEISEERFRLLIETANDLIFNLDSYGYFVNVNSYGALALGYKPEEMTGKHFLEFINEEYKAEIAIAFQQILKSDKVISFEAAFVDKFGKDIIFEIQGRPTKSNGGLNGMLGIGRDITQRRKDEEKLRELNTKLIEANRLISIERDRAKQQVSVLEELNKLKNGFISGISHELRTPLASIVGFSETITSDADMPREMVLEFANIILSEGKRLAKLINDLLDFAKLEGGKIEISKSEFDVIKMLGETVEALRVEAEAKGITLTADLPDIVLNLYADKERIAQVYQHLISNAIKFTEKGGRIMIIAQNFMKEFEVIVSDTGIGIPYKDQPNLFQKFYKTVNSGTQSSGIGIGLGLVKQIVDLHKGLISVQSEVNKGTTFIVKLPKKVEINR